MEKLWQDIRYGIRMLLKNRGFTIVGVLSLALGIGANTTIFTMINALLFNPLPVQDVSRLVQVDTIDSKTKVTVANAIKLGMSFPNYRDYRDQSDVFSGLMAFGNPPITLSGRGEPKQFGSILCTANYFDVLGVKPLMGRFFFPDEDQKPGANAVAVLSYALWAQEFGADPQIVGQSIMLNSFAYTVIGIAPQGFRGTFTLGNPKIIWIPYSMHDQVLAGLIQRWFNERRALIGTAVGRLKPGVPQAQAEAALQAIAARLEREYPVENNGRSVALTPLADAATLGPNARGQAMLISAILMSIVGLVLLIACVNLANLLLAQAARREREMSIRAAIGAGRARLVRQLLTESIVLAVLGGAVGLLVAYEGRNLLWSLRPSFLQDSALDISLNGRVLLFTFAISILTGLLFGLVPAIRISRTNLAETLKVGGRGGTLGWARSRFRQGLVVAEMALALVALISAGLFVRSMQFAQRIQLGFESKNLFVFGFDLGSLHYKPEQALQYYRDAIERAQAVAGVEAAAVSTNFPLGGGLLRTVYKEGQQQVPGQRGTLTNVNTVSPGYFRALRIPFLRGREFNESDRENTTPVAIINQAAAQHFWNNENAIGKRFTFFGDQILYEVVGIAGNTVVNAIGEDPQPVMYTPLQQNFSPFASLQVRTTGRPETVLASVRANVQSVERNLALTNTFTIGQLIDQGLWAPRMGAAMLSLFGLLALTLAAVGIYGVLSYSVNQQTHEIGVRMALGAKAADVLKLVVVEGTRLALIGVFVGVSVALLLPMLMVWVGGATMTDLLFGVSPRDPITFIAVPLLLSLVAALACYIPARRATRVDPLIALRYE